MEYGLGADKSPKDIRTFTYQPTKGAVRGGERYKEEDIEHQHKVGICTGISPTQMTGKVFGMRYSPDFQYLLQKKFIDNNWREGSSISSALKIAKKFGFLPIEHFPYIKESDRKLPYELYIKKLQAIPDIEIERLKEIASKNKILGYASVPVSRYTLANAIDESEAGILARFEVGEEWWEEPVEPLRKPVEVVSGHATIISNYNGSSFRIANTWGKDWADGGTAYFLYDQYRPTEAWAVYFNHLPEYVAKKLEQRETPLAKIVDYLQKVLSFFVN